MTDDNKLTHLNEKGEAAMVDVSEKAVTSRTAIARGEVRMAPETLRLIAGGEMKKGDVLAAARIAGVMAAKRCSDLIPLCHPLALSKVTVDFTPREAGADGLAAMEIEALVKVSGQTGVEMEALTAVSVAALTLYDMCKAVDKAMRIEAVRLAFKEGGRSGVYEAP